MKKQVLHITFHNPNTKEETARFLTKLIAQNLAEKMIFSQGNGQGLDSSPLPDCLTLQ